MFSHLDPRTILYYIVVSQIILLLDASVLLEASTVLLFTLPFWFNHQWRLAGGIVVLYFLQLTASLFWLPHVNNAVLLYPLSMLTTGFRELVPGILVGLIAFKFTTLAAWISLFKKWHLPKFFTVSFAVFFRFFPTIRADYRQIRDALAFRGIERGFLGFVKHPGQTFELILIPLLMNASQVASDLTISVLTKGLGLTGRQTSMVVLRLTKADAFYLAVGSVPILLALGGF